MTKKVIPLIFIILVWFVFSKPFFIDQKIPFPADLQTNNFALWSTYPKFWGPIKNPSQPDVISQIMPWKKFTIQSLKNGEIPFWNPYSFSGTPHLANYQSSTFSITNIFFMILNFNTAWGFSVIIQPLLAGLFIYLFLRSLKKSEIAGLISAISFMFCSFITTWMSYTTLSLAISFLPLILYAIQKYFDTKNYFYLLILTFSYPLSFFSGHFQTSIYLTFFSLIYITFKFIDTKNKKLTINSLFFSLLGILISLPQIFPSIEFYKLSVRSFDFQKIESLPLKYFTTVFSPDYFGNPVTRNVSFGSYAEWGTFFGTIPFFLAIFAILNKNKYVIFFLATGVVSILLSLNTPVLDFLIELRIPVISTSAAGRILVLFSFSFSVLAGFGMDYFINDLQHKKIKNILLWLTIIVLFIIFLWGVTLGKLNGNINYVVAIKNLIIPTFMFLFFIIFIFYGLLIKRFIFLLAFILLLLTSFDMLRFSSKWQTFSNNNFIFQSTPIISKIKSLDNNYRVYGPFGAEGTVYFGIQGTEGYDSLYINRYGEFIGSLNDGVIKSSPRQGLNFPTNAEFSPKIIDLLGIKYLIRKRSDEGKAWDFPFKNYPKKFRMIYKDNFFSIYENKNAYPKAYLVGDYDIVTSDQKIIDKILNRNFNLRKSVVLDKDPKINKNKNLVGEVNVFQYSPNRILIKANSKTDSILVINDNFYPGWKAKVNGEDKEIIRANYTFRSVPLKKGKSTVEFYFDSNYFRWGVYFSVISLLTILFIAFIKWYNNRKWIYKIKIVKSATKSFAKIANGKQVKKKQKK